MNVAVPAAKVLSSKIAPVEYPLVVNSVDCIEVYHASIPWEVASKLL